MSRAISELIATVLMILITIGAVFIIYQAVKPMLNLDTSKQCSSINLEIKNDWTYYDSTLNQIYISVSRGEGDANIVGLQIQIFGGGRGSSLTIKEGTTNPKIGEYNSALTIQRFNTSISLPAANEVRTYSFNNTLMNISKPESVSIAPVILIGKTESSCGVKAESSIMTY